MNKEFDQTEWENLLAGRPHRTDDPYLTHLREKCRRLLDRYNSSLDLSDPTNRKEILARLFDTEPREDILIQPPFYCDYGLNIHLGKNFMANFDYVILDCAPVYIGNNVLLAPKVQLYPVFHPTDPIHRRQPVDLSKPIRIGDSVWIGGGSIVLPGVTIGENTVIGAGSVVTKDVPANVIAVGNPCKVIRELDPSEYGKKMFL